MKKLFKNLLVAILAVCAICACAFGVAACKDKGDNTPNDGSTYTFIIQDENGAAINGTNVRTQICELGENGKCILLSMQNIYPDANGKLTLTQAKVNELFSSSTDVTVFSFHVMGVSGYNADCEYQVNGVKEYICQLYK